MKIRAALAAVALAGVGIVGTPAVAQADSLNCVIVRVEPGYAVCADPMDVFDIIYEQTGLFPPTSANATYIPRVL